MNENASKEREPQKGTWDCLITYPRPLNMTDEAWAQFAQELQKALQGVDTSRTVITVLSDRFTVFYNGFETDDFEHDQLANDLRTNYSQPPWTIEGPTFHPG